jgi:predicted nucleotidyltransferase component of viral defense system
MNKLSEVLAREINDFALEKGRLPSYVLEKDIFIVNIIEILLSLPVNHDFRLVFCGGTCLSKAYSILERMSEDIDFKIVAQTEAISKASKSSLRKKLGLYIKSFVNVLENEFGQENIKCKSRDENKYSEIRITYQPPQGNESDVLRREVLVELNYTELANPTENKMIGYLFDKLKSGIYVKKFQVECISLQEVFAEKLIAFPRRLAMALSEIKYEGIPDKLDNTLVRHLYDIYQLIDKYPKLLEDNNSVPRIVLLVIEKDKRDFKNQHPAFVSNPEEEILKAIQWADQNRELKKQYDDFIKSMVYSELEAPSFDEVFGHFKSVLQSLQLLQ